MTDLAIIGASIRTLDPARPHASAVAVRDGIVIAVDSRAPASSARRTRSATVPWRQRSTSRRRAERYGPASDRAHRDAA
jgi:hypothetical protein